MPDRGVYELLDLGGGVNQGIPPTQIAEREAVSMLNLYPYGPSLKRRPALTRYTRSLLGYEIVSLGAFYDAVSQQSLLVCGTQSTLYSYSGGTWTTLYDTGLSSYYPWTFLQYNRIGLFCRRGAGGLRWWRPGVSPASILTKLPYGVGDAGLTPPAGAPTLADGGADDLPAATFEGVYTYYDGDTGAESNPSPVSNSLTLAANRSVTWSGLVVSSNARVTARRFYRTLPDMPGQYFYVGSDNNTGTTYGPESVNTDDMGTAVSYRNGLPPSTVEVAALHREHLFVSDGRDLYFSEPGLPESFAAASLLLVGPDDGGRLIGLVSTPDRLLVLKTTGIWYVSGEDRGSWEVHPLADGHGCSAGHSAVWSNGLSIWLGEGGREVWASDGGTPVPIGTPRIKTFLDHVDPAYLDRVTAAIYEPLGWYILTFPDTGDPAADWADRKLTWIYAIREKVWFPWQWFVSNHVGTVSVRALRSALQYVERDGTLRLLGAVADLQYVYDLMSGTGQDKTQSNYSDDVTWSWTSKRLVGQQAHGQLQGVRRVSFLADWPPSTDSFSPASCDLNLLDESGASKAYRSVTLQPDLEWQAVNVNDIMQPRPSVQIKLSGASNVTFELRGLLVETLQYARRRRAQ